MKLFKYIKLAALGLVTLGMAAACQEEVDTLASAVLPEETSATFAAVSAPAQTMWVYADGDWLAEISADWLTIEPMSGTGNVEVTITVTDNVKNGAQDAPRSTVVYFKGASELNKGSLVIEQKGDTYLGSPEGSVSAVAELEDASVAKITSATVMGLTTNGMLISDGTTNMFVSGTGAGVKVGDTIFLNGKKTTTYGYPAFVLDECEILSSGTASYPEAVDITSDLDSFKPTGVQYFKLSGSLVTTTVRVAGKTTRLQAVNPVESLGFETASLHKVTVKGYFIGVNGSQPVFVATELQCGEADESLEPYPIKWHLGDATINFNSTWPDTYNADGTKIGTDSDRYVESVQGLGYITYVGNPDFTEDNSATKVYPHRDVSGNHPRITGAWTGDYWLFTGLGSVKAGSQMKITFEARVSATNPKYWKLQYLDGETWKTAGEEKTATDAGDKLTYTHMMNADGSTNIQVQETVKFNHNNEQCKFRFLCMTNYQANGSGPLSTRNGGSARISVTDPTSEDFQPGIVMVAEGDGVDIPDTDPEYATIDVSTDLLTFEGTPTAAQTITVTSTKEFTIAPDMDWVTLDVTEGLPKTKTTIKVTCAPSTLTTMRQGNLVIKSADSKLNIPVVQSAAGGDLDPLISISKNSTTVNYKAQEVSIYVQSNEEYTVTSDVPWITAAPATKSMVEKTLVTLNVEENTSTSEEREGHVVFAVPGKELQTVLTLTQTAAPVVTGEIIFEDDFSWLKPMIEEYNAANTNPIGDFVGGTYADISKRSGANAPNAYTAEPFASKFPAALAAAGYTDLNPSAKVIYPQDCYLKFGKTSVHTGLTFSPFAKLTSASDVTLSFDWVRHIQGTGTVDPVTLKVFIEGDGVFAATGTAESPDLTTEQVNGQDPFWTNAVLDIVGATSSTKLTIISAEGKASLKTSGAHRYHLDNIKIEKKPSVSKTIFKDDFSWVAPIVEAYNAASTNPVGKTVEDSNSSANAPNIWSTASLKEAFEPLFTAKGYTDLNPTEMLIYLQDQYLKFSKTGGHNTALQLSLEQYLTGTSDIAVTFDYCMMCQGSGTVDAGPIGIYIIGDGTFENGTKLSDPQNSAQEKSQYLWNTTPELKIIGATANTKLVFLNQRVLKEDGSFNWAVSGAGRFFLDNIEIVTK